MEGIALLRLAAEELAAGRAVVESVVLSTRGSVSRPAGARMLTLANGAHVGTVGGGVPEFTCQQAAAQVMAAAEPRMLELDHGSTGMVCGGVQTVGVRKLDATLDLPTLQEALTAADSPQPKALQVDWRAENPHFKLVPYRDTPTFENGVFTEPVAAPARALIFGAGHVGRALTAQLALLDFDVVVYDERPELATHAALPQAREIICDSYDNVAHVLPPRSGDFVCVMTASADDDIRVLKQVIPANPRYLGCMGSARKGAVVRKRLIRAGFSAEQIDAIDLPIGLTIGAVTPAEIALAIVAKLIEVKNAR